MGPEVRDQELSIIKAYLSEGRSHRWIEKNILKIDPDEHKGFEARKILIKYGFDRHFKDILLNVKTEQQFQELLKHHREAIAKNGVSETLLRKVWDSSGVIHIFQRVIQNTNGWTKPSIGRLGYKKDGGYLENSGFGHEDWNFNVDLNIEGYVYGYLYYEPAPEKRDKVFNIAFGERLAGGKWNLVGFYRNVRFVPDGAPSNRIIEDQKIADLQELRKYKSIGNGWDIDRHEMESKYKSELGALRWKVHIKDVVSLEKPIEITEEFDIPDNKHIRNPSTISKKTFDDLVVFGNENVVLDEESEAFPEGKIMFRVHQSRERNSELVKKAKANFLKQNGKLFCQTCDFDFEQKYGKLGASFIEAHHLVPVSKLKEGDKTRTEDLVMLCSNCHRMTHRLKQWVSDLETLKKSILQK